MTFLARRATYPLKVYSVQQSVQLKVPPKLLRNFTLQRPAPRTAFICYIRRDASFLSKLKDAFSKHPEPPIAEKLPDVRFHHGRRRVDEFSWMENTDDPKVLQHIKLENDYADQMTKNTALLRYSLLREMQKRLRIPKVLPPLTTLANGYEYYTRSNNHGQVYCRKEKGQGNLAKEEILLDTSFLRSTNSNIRKVLLSPDHTIFAYMIEYEGMETGSLHFKDLTGGKNVKNNVLEEVFNFVWANDNMTVYYTVPNEQLRPWQVYAHRIGTPQSHDILIFEEVDDMVFVDIVNTKDKKYITINANSLSASEVYVIDAHHDMSKGDTPPLKLIERRSSGIEYYVDHHDDHFYILTNADESRNFKLVRTPDAQPGREHWRDLIKVKSTEKIEDIDLFRSHAVVYAKREGLPVILCYDLPTLGMHEIALPEAFCVVNPGANLEFETDTFRFSINSPFAHESTWDYNMTSRKLTPVMVHPMYRFDATRFTCERIHVNAEDGVRIPVTLMHRKGIAMDGRNPVLMRSYGAYGLSTEPEFRVEHFPLLERGWVIALAHVRGGSELGRPWYEDGKLLRKKNTFTDFIAVAEYLVKIGVTNPDMLAATGTSAGGLLVGAMCHMRPDLFRTLILRVPFVDPLSAMLNPDLPLTRVEYPEWGNPTADPIAYDYIASYAPYDNVPEGRTRPSILVTAGLRDQRVACWHPLKFVARMRERDAAAGSGSDGSGIVLAKVDVDKGHFGAGGDQGQRLKESAFELAFLISQVQR